MLIIPKKNFLHKRKFYLTGHEVDLKDAEAQVLIDGGYAVRKGADATVKPKAVAEPAAAAAGTDDVFDPSAALGTIPGAEDEEPEAAEPKRGRK